jgi:NAD(P)-dependent dehydrogenase (short-subunit alcohol dehydrogenase family)
MKNVKPASLQGQVALITGGATGIGLALARSLAAQGCNLVLTGRDEKALKQAAREVDGHVKVSTRPCDVRDSLSVQELMAAVEGKFHRLDILVNNAGVGHENKTVAGLSPGTWSEVIETNLTGMFLVTHFALSLMKSGSVIVNNLSIAAQRVFPGSSAYNASKHGALGFTNTLREELRGKGIRVIALLPGATDTAIWKTLWPAAPRKKMMKPETVAGAVVSAILLPAESTVEQLVLLPSAGTL